MVVAKPRTRSWLKSYPAGVPDKIDYPQTHIGRLLDQVAASHGDAIAVVFESQTLTWSDVQVLATRLAAGLRSAGVTKGDRVGLFLPNVPQFVVAYYATLKLGAIVVPINPLLSETEIEALLRKTTPRVTIALDVLFEKIEPVWRETGVEHVIVTSAIDLLPARTRLAAGLVTILDTWIASLPAPKPLKSALNRGLEELNTRSHRIQRVREAPKPKKAIPYRQSIRPFRKMLIHGRSLPDEEIGPDDLAALLCTTGTTGVPKAAMLTHRNLIANAYQMRYWFPDLKEGKETILAVLPFFHAYGLTLVMNAGLVLAAKSVLIPRLIMSDILEAVQRWKPTALPGVPALFVSIINSARVRDYDLRSIRICVSGGAPLPLEVAEQFHEITGGYLYEGYGLTEASPLTHAQPYDQTSPPGSIGLPVSDTEARLIDEEGNTVAEGDRGELLVRGPQVMKGYWADPIETELVLRDGWLHTGDIATMDAHGFFCIVDRKKDLIITGGENIAPREIEEAVYRHPKVSEAVVAGIPHAMGGEIAKAFIVLKPGQTMSEAEMKRWLGKRIARFKVPREIEFRAELPKSPMGKILRRVLVEEARNHVQEPRRRRIRTIDSVTAPDNSAA